MTYQKSENERRFWLPHEHAMARIANGDKNVIALSIGDPDLNTPDEIKNAAIVALIRDDTHYTPHAGLAKLRNLIAEEANNSQNLPSQNLPSQNLPSQSLDSDSDTDQYYCADNVVVQAGAQQAIFSLFHCLLSAGDEVVVIEPNYLTYCSSISSCGGKPVFCAIHQQNDFKFDPRDLAACVNSRTRAIIFSNPANPTGVNYTHDELNEIIKIAAKQNIWVIADEVYSTLCYEREHVSMVNFQSYRHRIAIVNSLSKRVSMTGWRTGWLIAPRELASRAEQLARDIMFCLPAFVQQGAIAALNLDDEVVRIATDTYSRRRGLLAEQFANVDVLDIFFPQAGMFVLVNVSKVTNDSQDFIERLYEQQDLSVMNGAMFSDKLQGWIRISLGAPDDRLVEGCERIITFAQNYPQ